MLQRITNSKQRPHRQNLPFWLARLPNSKRSQQGYTLMESLVAVIIVAIIISTITPPIFLSAATRVRNRRAEQAMQLAQAEVDKIRRLVESGRYRAGGAGTEPDMGNSSASNPFYLPVDGGNDLRTVAGPEPREVDIDGDGSSDFLVQSFRNAGFALPSRPNQPVDFQMAVRVYSIRAKGNSLQFDKPASLQFTTANGGMDRRPLSVIYTRVTRSNLSNSLCSYYVSGGTKPPGCP